eukprot:10889003-Karenia_brevis.AAC.1
MSPVSLDMALCNAMRVHKQLFHTREMNKFPLTHVQASDHGLELHSIPCALFKGRGTRLHGWKAGASGHTCAR